MKEEFRPAIEALQKELAELEGRVIEAKKTINRLCEFAGAPPIYTDIGSPSTPSITALRADTFYGKVLHTAAREYLEMRKAANLGPAKPRDIYEALKEGGFAFEAKDANVAMIGLRATLRKNSGIFHRLPNGEYGLLSWYPNVRKKKSQPEEVTDEEEDDKDEQKAADDDESSAA